MDSIFHPFMALERVLLVPVSESTGLSDDKAGFDRNLLRCDRFILFLDSLCVFVIHVYISWILYEARSASIKN